MNQGIFAGAHFYDGSDDYFELGANTVMDDPFTERTVEMWINPSNPNSPSIEMIYEQGGSVNGFKYVYS